MFHCIAWRESIADIVENDIAPVQDGIMLIQNNHFVPQVDHLIQFAYFGGAGVPRARFNSPSLRQYTSPWIRPVNGAIVPVDEPNIADFRDAPLRIRGLEELELLGQQVTGGAAVVVGVAGIQKAPMIPAPNTDTYIMRGLGTTTAVAGAWTQAAITWQDTLPTGLYACVGLGFISTTALACRLIFENQVERPGCVGSGLVQASGSKIFHAGGLGVWGRFDANRMPNVEVLCNAADTTQEVYLFFARTA